MRLWECDVVLLTKHSIRTVTLHFYRTCCDSHSFDLTLTYRSIDRHRGHGWRLVANIRNTGQQTCSFPSGSPKASSSSATLRRNPSSSNLAGLKIGILAFANLKASLHIQAASLQK